MKDALIQVGGYVALGGPLLLVAAVAGFAVFAQVMPHVATKSASRPSV